MVTKSERLLKRLRGYTDIPADSVIRRCRPGPLQRSAGAWSWFAEGPDGKELCLGSQYSVTALLSAKELVVSKLYGDRHVDPLD